MAEGLSKERCGGKVLTLRPIDPPNLEPFEVVNVPALELVPSFEPEELIKALDEADAVLFTSRTGVRITLNNLPSDIIEKIKRKEVYAIGPSTAEELLKYGIKAKVPKVYTSEGVAEELKGKGRIVALRSNKASRTLKDKLGNSVIEIVVYKTERKRVEKAVEMIKRGEVKAVVISSAEIARSLLDTLRSLNEDPREVLSKIPVVVIGPEAAKPLEEAGVSYYLSNEATFEGVRRKLLELFCSDTSQ